MKKTAAPLRISTRAPLNMLRPKNMLELYSNQIVHLLKKGDVFHLLWGVKDWSEASHHYGAAVAVWYPARSTWELYNERASIWLPTTLKVIKELVGQNEVCMIGKQCQKHRYVEPNFDFVSPKEAHDAFQQWMRDHDAYLDTVQDDSEPTHTRAKKRALIHAIERERKQYEPSNKPYYGKAQVEAVDALIPKKVRDALSESGWNVFGVFNAVRQGLREAATKEKK
jgi:hypothetical protein